MSEIILGLIILILLGGFGWYVREQNKERAKLVNALLAKDTTDYVSRTLAEQTHIKPEFSKADNDLLPMDQVTDEQFTNHIKAINDDAIADQETV